MNEETSISMYHLNADILVDVDWIDYARLYSELKVVTGQIGAHGPQCDLDWETSLGACRRETTLCTHHQDVAIKCKRRFIGKPLHINTSLCVYVCIYIHTRIYSYIVSHHLIRTHH